MDSSLTAVLLGQVAALKTQFCCRKQTAHYLKVTIILLQEQPTFKRAAYGLKGLFAFLQKRLAALKGCLTVQQGSLLSESNNSLYCHK